MHSGECSVRLNVAGCGTQAATLQVGQMSELPTKLGRFVFALAAFGTPAVAAPPAKVELCHVPSGKTIEVTQSSVASHLAHGDYLGPCIGGDDCPDDPDKTEAGECGCCHAG